MVKGLSLLGTKEVSCPVGNKKTCFSEEEVNTYSKIIDCNNKMEPAKCPPPGRPHITLPGCPTVDDEYLKPVYNYKLPLKINKVDKSFQLVQDEDNPSYSELGSDCKNSINKFLNGFKADNFPPMKCGTEGSEYMSAADCDKISTENPRHYTGHVFNDGKLCEGGNCTYQDCCGEPPAQQCKDSQWNNNASCSAASDGHWPNYAGFSVGCAGPECVMHECCLPNRNCSDQEAADKYTDDQCIKVGGPNYTHYPEGKCDGTECGPFDCCKDTSPNVGCYVDPEWIALDPGHDEDESERDDHNATATTWCQNKHNEQACIGGKFGWKRANTLPCKWGTIATPPPTDAPTEFDYGDN